MDSEQIAARAAAFAACLPDAGRAWVADALDEPRSATAVRVALARAARKLGEAAVTVPASVALGAAPRVPWPARDVGRAAIVLRALAQLDPAAQVSLVGALVRRGEIGEQQSLLRMLAWLPEPARFVDIAIDACRTNAVPVFEAIAHDNPYPAAHFPDAAFDQLVLKAIFIGVAVDRIVGLAERVTEVTARMARDYADERRAAGRDVPDDVDTILELVAT